MLSTLALVQTHVELIVVVNIYFYYEKIKSYKF